MPGPRIPNFDAAYELMYGGATFPANDARLMSTPLPCFRNCFKASYGP